MSNQALPEIIIVEPKRPKNAPSYMQPQRPVLDEPLEPDGTKRHSGGLDQTEEVIFSAPANQAVIVTAPANGSEPDVDAPAEDVRAEAVTLDSVIADPANAEPEIADPDTTEDGAPIAGNDPVAESLMANPDDVQALLEQLQSVDLAEPAGKRRLSPFQGLIIALLVVLVILLLAMVFLYVSGLIELPPMMTQVIDKGLELVQ